MAPDLLTLSAICHEESNHPINTQEQPEVVASSSSPVQTTESELTKANTMGNPNDARKRSLVSIYSTGFVFNQNQKELVKSIPWTPSTQHNPVPKPSELQKLVSQIAEGRGNGRKEIVEEQIQGMKSEKVRKEHAASMFALLI